MKAEDRTKNLMLLLGWKGGTIHDACKALGIADSHSFLYDSAEFDDGPNLDFRRGYRDACKYRRAPWSDRVETTEYWLGAVCAVTNDFGPPDSANAVAAHGDKALAYAAMCLWADGLSPSATECETVRYLEAHGWTSDDAWKCASRIVRILMEGEGA